jgi:hypothetical protein
MGINAKLKKVFDTHLPVDEASSRSIQRVAALWLGHTSEGRVDPAALRELCNELQLFDYEGKKGENNFGANFAQNMTKDHHYFDGDKTGWKLTAVGKAEAKSIFDDGNPPTRRISTKPKKEKKPKEKKEKKAKAPKAEKAKAKPAKGKKGAKATPKKEKKAKEPKADTTAPSGDEAAKAAAKKRVRAKKAAAASSAPVESAPENASAPEAVPVAVG